MITYAGTHGSTSWHQQPLSALSSRPVTAALIPNEVCLGVGLNPSKSYRLDDKGDANLRFAAWGGSWFRELWEGPLGTQVLPQERGASPRFWGGLGEVSSQVELGSPGQEDDLDMARRCTGARKGVLDQPCAFWDAGCLTVWPWAQPSHSGSGSFYLII